MEGSRWVLGCHARVIRVGNRHVIATSTEKKHTGESSRAQGLVCNDGKRTRNTAVHTKQFTQALSATNAK